MDEPGRNTDFVWRKETGAHFKILLWKDCGHIMDDILWKTDGCIFDVRTVGVLIKNGKILVQRGKNGNEYALPGDHVKPGETTVDRLGLEFREETGSDIHANAFSEPKNAFMSLMVKAAQHCLLLSRKTVRAIWHSRYRWTHVTYK